MNNIHRVKKETTLLCLIVVFVVLMCLWSAASVRYVTTPGNSVPLHDAEYRQLQESLYAYYNEGGYLPDDDRWMNEADRAAMRRAAGAITWNGETKTLHYEYDKPYSTEPGVLHVLSFGRISSKGPMGVGRSLSEEHIIHNAKLRAGS